MRHTISGQRREDRARRTIAVGTFAAVVPILGPASTVWADWSVRGVILVTMLTTIAAAAVVGLLLLRITRLMALDQRRFDEERRRWREEAQTDALCSIPNRRGAYDQIEQMRRAAGAGAFWTVLAIDVDRFKEVNDGHGHAVGDRVLAAVASTLAEQLPESAAVARWGGDEFVVFMLGDRHVPSGFAEGLAAAVAARPIPCREGDLHVGISLGLAEGPACNTFDDVLALADDALLGAKSDLRRPVTVTDADRRAARAAVDVVETRSLTRRSVTTGATPYSVGQPAN
jgi:diguanylate cyclase (GGDEF)-like protein